MSEDLCHNLRLSNRATSQGMEAVVRREQADVTIATLQPQYTALVGRAKKLQSQVWRAGGDLGGGGGGVRARAYRPVKRGEGMQLRICL